MTTSVVSAEEVLRGRYDEALGADFLGFVPTLEPGERGPAWRWIDARLRPNEEAAGALLLDGEIGLCLYLLPFTRETRLQDQLERAAAISGRMEPARDTGARASDPNGAWRVAVHWLVEGEDFDAWAAEVARLRAETDLPEAVAVDAVVNRGGGWTEACVEHGFPRLLLTTRRVLRLEEAAGVEAWAGTDTLSMCSVCDKELEELHLLLVRHRGEHRIADGFCSMDHLVQWSKKGGRWSP